MASLVGYMANTVGAGFKQTLIEMAGVRSHNICDPFLWTSNIVNPVRFMKKNFANYVLFSFTQEVPLCMAFPDETLQVGTLISITASLNSSFSKRCLFACLNACCLSCVARRSTTNRLADYNSAVATNTATASTPMLPDSSLPNNTRPNTNQQSVLLFLKCRFRIDFIMRSCEHRRAPELEKSPVDRSDQYSIGFHFNARFGGGNQEENFGDVVVMNSRLDGQWGEEQRDTRFPFKLNVPFRMMILIKEESFNIAVDDQHIYEFKHRANLHEIGKFHFSQPR